MSGDLGRASSIGSIPSSLPSMNEYTSNRNSTNSEWDVPNTSNLNRIGSLNSYEELESRKEAYDEILEYLLSYFKYAPTKTIQEIATIVIPGAPEAFFNVYEKFVTKPSLAARSRLVAAIKAFKTRANSSANPAIDPFILDLYFSLLPLNIPNVQSSRSIHMSQQGGGTRKKQKQKQKTVKISGGKTFPVENPTKRWTRSKKYKRWISKLTRKQEHHTKAEDLCVGSQSICKGDLGISRKYMPQFNSPKEIARFRTFVKRVYGIKSCRSTRKASQMRPSQGEINRKRITGLIEDGILVKVNVPLIVSGDNYVVDGHHRWAAYKLKKPEKKLPVIVIDAPVKDVLGIAVAWGAKHQEF